MELRKLASIANKLDSLGLTKEADVIDKYIRKVALDLPNTDVDSLPDSPEEVAAQKAKTVQPMMQTQTYGQGATSIRGVTKRPEDTRGAYNPAVLPKSNTSAPTAKQIEDAKLRKQISESMGKSVKKPNEIKNEYGFNFTPTMGKTGNVIMIQKGLAESGFNPGPIDGYWGGRTDMAFKDAIHAFAVLAPEAATAGNLINIVDEIAVGNPSSLQFSLALVMEMFDHIKSARQRGEYVSSGRPINNYSGSMGGGRFEQKNLKDEATLRSTKAGEPVAGNPKK